MVEAINVNVNGKGKKILAVIILLSFVVPLFSFIEVSALKIGDEIGNVLNTDIKTYIDGERIPSYNIGGRSAVLIKDLVNYGFNSVYDDKTRTSRVTQAPNKKKTPITNFEENTKKPGTVAFKYVYTDIVAYVNNKKVESFNIKGNLAIYFGSLKDYGTFAYNDKERVSRFTSNKSTLATGKEEPTNSSTGQNKNSGNSNNNTNTTSNTTDNINNNQNNTIAQNNTNDEYYTVKFNLNYSNPQGSIPDQRIKKGSYASRPTTENVKRSNYLLTGWYTDKDCKNEFSFDTAISRNITLYAKWIIYDDFASSHKDLVQVSDMLSGIQKKYYNDKGYVEFSDFSKVLEDVAECTKSLYEQGKILYYKYSVDGNSITIRLKSEMLYVYTPKNSEILSGGGVGIETYMPCDDVMPDEGPEMADKYSEMLPRGIVTVESYITDKVDIKTVENMSGDIIFWFGHGIWVGDESYTGCALKIGEKYSDETWAVYRQKFPKGAIGVCGEGDDRTYFITGIFINSLKGKPFDNSLIYLNSCHSLQNDVLAKSFINKGAGVVIGYTNVIRTGYGYYLFKNITAHLLERESKNVLSNLNTVQKAIDLTLALPDHEEERKEARGYNSTEATVTWYGERDFRLTKLVANSEKETHTFDELGLIFEFDDKKGTAKVVGVSDTTRKSYSIPYEVGIRGKVYDVTEIVDRAFDGVKKAQITGLPEKLEKIGAWAFENMDLSKCKLHEIKTLSYIGQGAFYNAKLPSNFTLKDYKHIGEQAFYNVSGIETLTIDYNFEYSIDIVFTCSTIKDIKVANGNKKYQVIDKVLYSKGNKDIDLYIYPTNRTGYNSDEYFVADNTKTIKSYAFYYSGLKEIILKDTVDTIEGLAFYNCKKLKSVEIRNEQASIAKFAIIKESNQEIEIHGYTGSSAEKYVEEYNKNDKNDTNLEFISLGEEIDTKPKPLTTTGVEGTVVDAETEKPIQGVKVTLTLYDEDTNTPTKIVMSGLTDSKGKFKITDCLAGTYKIEFEKEGYVSISHANILLKSTIEDVGIEYLSKNTIGIDVPDGAIGIKTEAELRAIPSGATGHYVLANDISLKSEWVPIDDFRGTFDGQGHKILNLRISTDNKYTGVGLFSSINGATIKNVGIENSSINVTNKQGTLYVGAIAGYATSSKIISCYNVGSIYGGVFSGYGSGNAGGLIGRGDNESTIINCYNNSSVLFGANSAYVGGIAGYFVGSIQYCYSMGKIQNMSGGSGANYTGGIAGRATRIEYCIALQTSIDRTYSTVSGNYDLIGYTTESKKSNYAIQGVTGVARDDANRRISLEEAKSQATYEAIGWDLNKVWGYKSGVNNGYPVLRAFYKDATSGNTSQPAPTTEKPEVAPTDKQETIQTTPKPEVTEPEPSISAPTTSTGVQGRVIYLFEDNLDVEYPLSGVVITLYDVTNSAKSYRAVSDDRGMFKINCPKGMYILTITLQGEVYELDEIVIVENNKITDVEDLAFIVSAY